MQVLENFRESVARRGDKAAIVSPDSTLSYRQLDDWSSALAGQLRARGVQRGAIVPLCLPRSPEFVVAALAVMKAGAAYLPLGVDLPPQRLQAILAQCAPPCVLAPAAAQPLCGVDVIGVQQARQQAPLPAAHTAAAADLAYVVFTSGSTGVPKGVLIDHAALGTMVEAFGQRFGLTDADRTPFVGQVSFDAVVMEIWPTLCCGATLYLPSDEVRLSGSAMREWLRQHAITVCWLPTPLMEHMLSTWEADQQLPSLRLLLTAGDRLTVRPPAHLACTLVNCYGPSETTVIATAGDVAVQAGAAAAPHIGRPLAPCRVYLLDDALQPVPAGEIGELHIGGGGVGRGYLHDPALTAQVFRADPFSEQSGARMYATGDLCRYDSAGNLEYVGRKDRQVKIRGNRVELSEIEAHLAAFEGMHQVAVIPYRAPGGHSALAAFVVGNADASPAALRERLAAMVPAYMLPWPIVPLAQLPLTAHGKVDRAALESILADAGPGPASAAAAADGVLDAAACFARVLPGVAIAPDTSFFAAGGDSMGAVVLLDLLHRHLGVRIPIAHFFDHPTVAEVAAYCHAGPASTRVRVGARDPAARVPMSASQEAVWFMLQRAPDSHAYHARSLMKLRGKLDVRRLEDSLGAVVARHEIFRTTFGVDADGPVQIVHPPFPVQLAVHDMTALALEDAERACIAILNSDMDRHFNVAELPLVRWQLVRIRDDYHVLLHVEHHFVHDGWSYNVFLAELDALYRDAAGHGLGECRQFGDFALAEAAWLDSDAARQQLDYWTRQLADAPPLLTLPGMQDLARRDAGAGGRRLTLPRAVWRRCERVAAACGVTPFIFTLAVLNVVLARYANQNDISIGSALANRNWQDSGDIIGMMVNTVVMRNRVDTHARFSEFLQHVRATCLGAYDNQEFPFSRLVSVLNPDRGGDHNPLFQVMLGFHDSPTPALNLPHLEARIVEAISSGFAKVALSLVVIPRLGQEGDADPVHLVWEWNADVLTPGLAEQVIDSFMRVHAALLDDVDTPVAALPVVSQDEQLRLRALLAGPAVPVPQITLHQALAQVAAEIPQACAVVDGAYSISHADLQRRSTELAAHIGHYADAPIGICMGPSIDMIVAIVATLKAGAAYMPLDPAHPPERLASMVAGSGARCILSTGDLLAALPHGVAGIAVDGAPPAAAVPDVPGTRANPGANAYVIHTSGTSGRPKGVALAHSGVVNLLGEMQARAPVARLAAHALWTNPAFDVSVYEIFSALLGHGCLHLVPAQVRAEPAQLFAWLAQHAIASAYIPPFFVEQLLQWAAAHPGKLALRRLLVGVEPIQEASLAALQEQIPGLQVVNGYGPSEATVCCTLYSVPRHAGQHAGTAPIGTPVRNMQLYVLDADLNLCPAGTTGELYVGGVGVASGYLGQAGADAARFLANPFGDTAAPQLYRTGDQVRLLADGNLRFIGRADQQVKIRGYRVEPGEVEAVLRKHAAVQDAVVCAQPGADGNHFLAAYVVLEQELGTDALADHLRTFLPAYMMPGVYIPLERLPVTANGKIDRKALPSPDAVLAARRSTAPATPLEVQVAALFAHILQREVGSTDQSFFEMGGHSLLAVRLISRLYRDLGITIEVTEFFEHPTVAALASLIGLKQELQQQGEEDDEYLDGELVF